MEVYTVFFFFFFFRQGMIAQADLDLTLLLPLPPECWDYKCVPPHPDLYIF
jgi:hypothetical protein